MEAAESTLHRVSVFGLGKLGAVIAGCWASRGFSVIGVEVNERLVDLCKRGIPPVQEPDLERIFHEAQPRLSATLDGKAAVRDTDITLIAVPTPSETSGGYSLKYILDCCEVIGRALREKDGYHLVVIKSTVLPGATNADIIPALEKTSGKCCGPDFGVCYNPEFIALGSVVRNLFYPDFLLIGESDGRAGDMLVQAHSRMLRELPPTSRMKCVNAELAKLAVNSFITMKITYANLIAQLCEQLPEGDARIVTHTLGLDPRIGPQALKGGLGFGGPCFPRDNAAMLSLARRLGVPFPLAATTDKANTELTLRIAKNIEDATPRGGRVAILGLSYKPDTPVVEESQGLLIAKILADRGLDVVVYDPLAIKTAEGVLGAAVSYAQSVDQCVEGADVVAITTPWEQFRCLPLEKLNGSGPRIVFDCWGICTNDARGLAQIRILGVGPRSDTVANSASTTNSKGG